MATHHSSRAGSPDVLVAGAGLTGLTTALVLARAGHRVVVVDGDAGPSGGPVDEAAAPWDRAGVGQFHQPHVLLPRWHALVGAELPDLLDDLGVAGVRRSNLLHLQPDSVTCGWEPGDERFDTVAVRRPVLETVLARLAAREPRVTLRRGVRVSGLLHRTGADGIPAVQGLRTTDGDLTAGLVVDATGRRTRCPAHAADAGRGPEIVIRDAGFVYYTRQFRLDAQPPRPSGPVLSHHESFSVLTVPQDGGTYAVGLVTGAHDDDLRCLRDGDAWSAVARLSPVAAPWLAAGTPTTEVMPYAAPVDVRRRWVTEDGVRTTGLVAVGDAWATTAPLLGRGASLGALHAVALRDVLADRPDDPRDLAQAVEAEAERRVGPWVEASWSFATHRAAQLAAEASGTRYETDDPAWAATCALLAGSRRDPVLARASSAVGGLLDAPSELLTRPEVGVRLRPYLTGPAYGTDDPSRRDVERAVLAARTVAR